MPRKVKIKYHYLYKTTNLINGKYYIGIHSTYKIKDGYLGSGTRLWNSIYKYGKENFVKEELEFFENREELLQREKEIVNEQCLQDPLCMNLMIGGKGGFSEEMRKKALAKRRWLKENDIIWFKNFKEKISKGNKKVYDNGRISVSQTWWIGKKHGEETKKKISDKAKSLVVEKNSQFGTCWINNKIKNKKIKSSELNFWLNLKWKKGRIVIGKKKLNEKEINEIVHSKEKTTVLSKRYDVSNSTIKRIKKSNIV